MKYLKFLFVVSEILALGIVVIFEVIFLNVVFKIAAYSVYIFLNVFITIKLKPESKFDEVVFIILVLLNFLFALSGIYVAFLFIILQIVVAPKKDITKGFRNFALGIATVFVLVTCFNSIFSSGFINTIEKRKVYNSNKTIAILELGNSNRNGEIVTYFYEKVCIKDCIVIRKELKKIDGSRYNIEIKWIDNKTAEIGNKIIKF